MTGSVSVENGSQISVQGVVTLSPGSTLQVTVNQAGPVTVVSQAAGFNGEFTTVQAVPGPSTSTCTAPVNPPTTTYGTSLTVTVAFTNTCGGGLSTAAIIGIAVAAGVVGLALIGGLIGLLVYRARERAAMQQITGKLATVVVD